jgi:hypothetical protein
VIPASIASVAVVATGHPSNAPSWTAYVTFALLALMFGWGPLYVLWTFGRGTPGGGDSGDGDGGGGGGWGGGDNPPKSPPGTDPEWWPEFERQFEAHVQRGSLPVKRAP